MTIECLLKTLSFLWSGVMILNIEDQHHPTCRAPECAGGDGIPAACEKPPL